MSNVIYFPMTRSLDPEAVCAAADGLEIALGKLDPQVLGTPYALRRKIAAAVLALAFKGERDPHHLAEGALLEVASPG
jgi:hypothetical protein